MNSPNGIMLAAKWAVVVFDSEATGADDSRLRFLMEARKRLGLAGYMQSLILAEEIADACMLFGAWERLRELNRIRKSKTTQSREPGEEG